MDEKKPEKKPFTLNAKLKANRASKTEEHADEREGRHKKIELEG